MYFASALVGFHASGTEFPFNISVYDVAGCPRVYHYVDGLILNGDCNRFCVWQDCKGIVMPIAVCITAVVCSGCRASGSCVFHCLSSLGCVLLFGLAAHLGEVSHYVTFKALGVFGA